MNWLAKLGSNAVDVEESLFGIFINGIALNIAIDITGDIKAVVLIL